VGTAAGQCGVCGAPPGGYPVRNAWYPPTPQEGGQASTGSGSAGSGSAFASGTSGSGTFGSGTAGSGSTGGRSSGRTSSRSGGRRSTRGSQLGAGLVEMPQVPPRDPANVVLSDPQVPEHRRFCGACGHPVGRSRNGQPGLVEGFCPRCRTRFSFRPRLRPGELVGNRYEILGCLAYGGLGWIYLARDRHISDAVSERWVVLKGLINTDDPDAVAAAVAERRFLVEVDHPAIVKIHDFTSHPDPFTGTMVGYIVMEYIDGRSLRQLSREHRDAAGRRTPLPLPQVLAYAAETLQALGYLHDQGLLYCDLKPDNILHAGDQLKLIDLGAVRRIDDKVSAVYGTPGYQAPEVATIGPSISSDLYTVARTMAVLSFDFPGFSTEYAHRLPDRAAVPLLAYEESYDRLLRRATDPDPNRRFTSAEQMREQVLGVLREVLSVADGEPRPAMSTLFTEPRGVFGTEAGSVTDLPETPVEESAAPRQHPVDWKRLPGSLPAVRSDPADPAVPFLATVVATDPRELIGILMRAPVRSPEVTLRLIQAKIMAGDPVGAMADLEAYARYDPFDWRILWYRGMAALAGGQPTLARSAFDQLYDELPGELAPKLALAAAAEWCGDDDSAFRLYTRVWRTDRAYVSAAFGLARVLRRRGNRGGAVSILDQVPDTSSQYTTAQIAAIRARLGIAATTLTDEDLLDAARRLENVGADALGRERWLKLSVEILTAALGRVRAGQAVTNSGPWPGLQADLRRGRRILGYEWEERALRMGLERCYRDLATLTGDRQRRIALVDRANRVRPRTLV